jgi:hypothetical protein
MNPPIKTKIGIARKSPQTLPAIIHPVVLRVKALTIATTAKTMNPTKPTR